MNEEKKPVSYDFVHRVHGNDVYMVIESELHLLQMNSWSADGTFKGVSLLQEYSQIYIISIVKQLPDGICYFPIMISILQKKDKGSDEYKVGCLFPMVVVSILPHADFGPNDHRDDALHFTMVHNDHIHELT